VGRLGSTTKLNYACLYDDCYSNEPRDLQLLADARLIAAAPDLLAACKLALGFAVNFRETVADWERFPQVGALFAKMRVVIDAAEANGA